MAGKILVFQKAEHLTDEVLLSELDKRALRHRDQPPGTSEQPCPVCSTPGEEVLGTWHRSTSRFECRRCGASLRGDRYEDQLHDYYARRWRAERESENLAALRRTS